MGIVFSVHQLDADAYARSLQLVATRHELTLDDVRPLLAELGRDEPARFQEAQSWEEVAEEVLDDDDAECRWFVVLAASWRTQCCIDKAIDRPAGGFRELFTRERSLAAVGQLFREGEVPTELTGATSLMRIVPPDEVARMRDAMRPWLDGDARANIAALQRGFFGRLFGPRDWSKSWTEQSYLWDNWRALGDVVSAAAREREPLAVTWG
jgi:hypothetical protein